jgi:S1-C subfamily serine protease
MTFMIGRTRTFALFVILLVLAGVACSISTFGDNAAPTPVTAGGLAPTAAVESSDPPLPDTPVLNSPGAAAVMNSLDLESALIDLYESVNPSVVHILVYTSRNDPQPLGSGSGFIFDQAGRIVTNNHVVEDGNVFEVIFSDGTRERADVVGRDVDSDLAVIGVDSLPATARPVLLGDSNTLQVGQLVIAIGNPFGQQGSMSLGIVSGVNRSLESQRSLDFSSGSYSLPEVIQTDAPINPGNSGGPLLNLSGHVVGVNSAIRSTTGVNSGVGFSIPVNAVRRIIPTLIEKGSYDYAFMGVQIQSLNLNLQEQYGLSQVTGAYVTRVEPNSPASEAGLVAAQDTDGVGGDLIVAVDGRPVRDTEELISYLVFNSSVGQTIELSVLREGKITTVPLTLGERP